jgi:hypothetical protein
MKPPEILLALGLIFAGALIVLVLAAAIYGALAVLAHLVGAA